MGFEHDEFSLDWREIIRDKEEIKAKIQAKPNRLSFCPPAELFFRDNYFTKLLSVQDPPLPFRSRLSSYIHFPRQNAPFWFARNEFTSSLGCLSWKRQVLLTSIQLTRGDGASQVSGSIRVQLPTCLQLRRTCGETCSLTQPNKASSRQCNKVRDERLSH